MTQLLPLILPIFLLMAVGFAAVRARFISEAQVQALGVFVLNFALPALILNALLRQDLRQTLDWNYIAAYAFGSLAAFAAVFLVARFVLRRPLDAAAIAALGASAANSGFVGFPVAQLALGAVALTALPLSMLVENILIIPLALALGEMARHQGGSPGRLVLETGRRLSRSPLILAILAGSCWRPAAAFRARRSSWRYWPARSSRPSAFTCPTGLRRRCR
jgi:predicted permease